MIRAEIKKILLESYDESYDVTYTPKIDDELRNLKYDPSDIKIIDDFASQHIDNYLEWLSTPLQERLTDENVEEKWHL